MHLKMTIIAYFLAMILYHFEIREYLFIKHSEKQGIGPDTTLSLHFRQGLASLSLNTVSYSVISVTNLCSLNLNFIWLIINYRISL